MLNSFVQGSLFLLLLACTLVHALPCEQSLIAWYKFEDNILDSSSNKLHPNNTISFLYYDNGVSGKCLQASSFSAFNFYDFPLFVKPSFSICFWLNTTENSPDPPSTLLSYGDLFKVSNPSNVTISVGYFSAYSSAKVNDGLWHHLCITYDNNIMVYLDGIAKPLTVLRDGVRVLQPRDTLYFGSGNKKIYFIYKY
jgi:hypothetical protein